MLYNDAYIQRQLILTLSYSLQFSFPLTRNELWLRLITQASIPQDLVEKNIKILIATGRIVEKESYLQLPGQADLSTEREHRSIISQQKMAEAAQFIALANHIPWIELVAITGSVAVENATEDADIDFLIITQPGRLWLTRILVTCIALIKKKRRSWKREEKKSWCFNMWMDIHHMCLPNDMRTVYGAYELCQPKWIFVRNEVALAAFYSANNWAKRKIYNYFTRIVGNTMSTQQQKSLSDNWFLDCCEGIAYVLQQKYMEGHQTREKVSPGIAFFHPRDTKTILYSKWIEVLQTL